MRPVLRRFLPVLVAATLVPAAAPAQVQSRPTEAPLVTAEHDDWFLQGEPVQHAGNTYYKAGAAVFFDGNRMVRSGDFHGIPLYADATLEPFSVVFVPIARGLMQPYERPRSGDLAGTTGSRAPSFPVSALPTRGQAPVAASPPTNLPPAMPGVSRSEEALVGANPIEPAPPALDAATHPGAATGSSAADAPAADLRSTRERVWVEYQGQRWFNAGAAVPLEGSGLTQTGQYAGFPVYARADGTQGARIYLPALAGLVTPYERQP